MYFVLLTVALAYALLQPNGGIRIDHFSWSTRGMSAPFVFRIKNKSNEERTAIVVITADREVSRGHEGLAVSTVGRTNLEVTLGGHEEKWVNGSVHTWGPHGIVVLSHYTRIKQHDQAGQASRTKTATLKSAITETCLDLEKPPCAMQTFDSNVMTYGCRFFRVTPIQQ